MLKSQYDATLLLSHLRTFVLLRIRPDLIRNWRRGRFKLPLLETSQEKLAKEAENSNLPRADFYFSDHPCILHIYCVRVFYTGHCENRTKFPTGLRI